MMWIIIVETFCEEWVLDAVALGLFLSFQLSKHFGNIGETKATEFAGLMIERSIEL